VGHREVVRKTLAGVLAQGHVLFEDYPGLGKTLLVKVLARTLQSDFRRVQFTPDILPSDILGARVWEHDRRAFVLQKGPVFTNILLADEINRAPPKTQSALLEAMEERQVTIDGETLHLDPPFFVLATQNPIEQEGTYPLPEAQLDRFMLELEVPYPSRSEEEEIVEETTGDDEHPVKPVLNAEEVLMMQHLVRRIPAPKPIVKAAVHLARMTRPKDAEAPDFVREYVSWGAGPRASQFLVLGAKARAALDGRPMADLDDVKSVALSVLRHRVVANFAAEAAGRSAQDVCRQLIDETNWTAGA
jgi:MoxR-like ATPase